MKKGFGGRTSNEPLATKFTCSSSVSSKSVKPTRHSQNVRSKSEAERVPVDLDLLNSLRKPRHMSNFPRFQKPNFHALFEHPRAQVNSQRKESQEDSTKTSSKELPTTLHQRSWRASTATHSRQIACVSGVFLVSMH